MVAENNVVINECGNADGGEKKEENIHHLNLKSSIAICFNSPSASTECSTADADGQTLQQNEEIFQDATDESEPSPVNGGKSENDNNAPASEAAFPQQQLAVAAQKGFITKPSRVRRFLTAPVYSKQMQKKLKEEMKLQSPSKWVIAKEEEQPCDVPPIETTPTTDSNGVLPTEESLINEVSLDSTEEEAAVVATASGICCSLSSGWSSWQWPSFYWWKRG